MRIMLIILLCVVIAGVAWAWICHNHASEMERIEAIRVCPHCAGDPRQPGGCCFYFWESCAGTNYRPFIALMAIALIMFILGWNFG